MSDRFTGLLAFAYTCGWEVLSVRPLTPTAADTQGRTCGEFAQYDDQVDVDRQRRENDAKDAEAATAAAGAAAAADRAGRSGSSYS